MSILLQTSSMYPSLKKAERRVADVLLKTPEAVRAVSITQYSEMSGVSLATVNRFCRTLGFNGYTDFMHTLIADLASVSPPPSGAHLDITDNDSDDVLLMKVMTMDIQAIQDTMDYIDVVAFRKAVEALANAKMIGIFGVGSSQPVAMDMYYRLLQNGLHCTFSTDSHMQAINAALLVPGDVALAISHSGETHDILDCIELAKNENVTTICITSFAQSRLAKLSGIYLTTTAKKSFWLNEAIPSRLAQLALCDALCVGVAMQNRSSTRPVAARIAAAVTRKRR